VLVMTPVSRAVALTVTPGSNAFDASVIVPVTVAKNPPWLNANVDRVSISNVIAAA